MSAIRELRNGSRGGDTSVTSSTTVDDAAVKPGVRKIRFRSKKGACGVLICGSISVCCLGVLLLFMIPFSFSSGSSQFGMYYYAPNETRITSVPTFICDEVTVSATTDEFDYTVDVSTFLLGDQKPPLSTYSVLPVTLNNPDSTKYKIPAVTVFLHVGSKIKVTACAKIGNTYLLKGQDIDTTELSGGLLDLNNADVILSKPVPSSCEENAAKFTYTVNETDVYAVAFVGLLKIEDYDTYDLQATIEFNRTEYSINELNSSFPNCTFRSSDEPCSLSVPLADASILIVTGWPQDSDNQYQYTAIRIQCNRRLSSLLVLIFLPPILGTVLCCGLALFCHNPFSKKSGYTPIPGNTVPTLPPSMPYQPVNNYPPATVTMVTPYVPNDDPPGPTPYTPVPEGNPMPHVHVANLQPYVPM